MKTFTKICVLLLILIATLGVASAIEVSYENVTITINDTNVSPGIVANQEYTIPIDITYGEGVEAFTLGFGYTPAKTTIDIDGGQTGGQTGFETLVVYSNDLPGKVTVTVTCSDSDTLTVAILGVNSINPEIPTRTTVALQVKDPVAEANGVKYLTLQAAVDATQDGTIKLLSDAVGGGVFVNPNANKNIEIDFNGKTYTFDEPVGSTGTINQGFHLEVGNNITLKNGTLNVKDESKNKFRFIIQNYCNLTLDGMDLDGSNLMLNDDRKHYVLSNNCGITNLKGCTKITANENDIAFDICDYASYVEPNVTVDTTGTITGDIEYTGGKDTILTIKNISLSGSFIVDDTYKEYAEKANSGILISGGTFDEQVKYEYCAEGMRPSEKDSSTGKYTVLEGAPVAMIDRGNDEDVHYFEKLSDAFKALKDNDTIVMLNDANTIEEERTDFNTVENFTLNLNGKKINDNGKTRLIRIDAGTVKINGSTPGSQIIGGLLIYDGGNVSIEGGEYSSPIHTSDGDGAVLYTNGNPKSGDFYVTVKDATFRSTDNVAFYFPGGNYKYTIENCTIEANTGIYMKSGSLTIKDSIINATGESKEPVAYGNGYNVTGDGIVLDTNSGYAGDMKLSISNTTINSTNGFAIRECITTASVSETKSLEISSGTFNGSTDKGAISVTDSFINEIIAKNVTPAISGGTYSSPVLYELCAEGYISKDNGDGTYRVEKGKYVAKIMYEDQPQATKYFENLGDAITAVNTGETITMMCDVPNAVGISVPSGKEFTIDFNNTIYTVSLPGAGSPGTETQAFQLLAGSTITFKNGKITVDGSNLETSKVESKKNIKMLIQNYANLTLTNMSLDGTNLNHDTVNYSTGQVTSGKVRYVVSNNCGTVLIDGSTSITAATGDFAFDICKYESYPEPTVTVDTTGKIIGNIQYDGREKTVLYIKNIIHEGKFDVTETAKQYAEEKDSGILVSGGTFDNFVKPGYWAEGCKCTGTGPYTVEPKTYNITYYDGDVMIEMTPNPQKVTSGFGLAASGSGLANESGIFLGWSNGSIPDKVDYHSGEIVVDYVNDTADVTLYAVWGPASSGHQDVFFNTGGINVEYIPENEEFSSLVDSKLPKFRPFAYGYIFSTWMKGDSPYAPATPITGADIGEYIAIWTAIPGSGELSLTDVIGIRDYVASGTGDTKPEWFLSGSDKPVEQDLIIAAQYVADKTANDWKNLPN